MARENEKVVGTRLNEADQEALEILAVLKDQTIGALLRTAVREFIEKEQRHIHPLSLEAAVSIGGAIGAETSLITGNATSLNNASYGDAGGVYLLVHPESRELYVGSSTELTNRLTHHKFSIKTGTHKNSAINGWCLEEVVVVVLESCEAVKNAETKRSLLAREQHYIDVLELSKDWTLLNLVVASKEQQCKTGKTPVMGNVNTPVVKTAVPTASNNDKEQIPSTAFQGVGCERVQETNQQFYTVTIEQELLPLLNEQQSSRDVVRLFEGCKDETEQRWFLEFLRSYDSLWLTGLASSGKFPWIQKLLDEAEKTNF